MLQEVISEAQKTWEYECLKQNNSLCPSPACYVPTVVSQAELRAAVSNAGFEALELGDDAEDAEAKARQHEISVQYHLLLTGLVFTVPLFLFSMLRDFNLLGIWAHESWVNWIM